MYCTPRSGDLEAGYISSGVLGSVTSAPGRTQKSRSVTAKLALPPRPDMASLPAKSKNTTGRNAVS